MSNIRLFFPESLSINLSSKLDKSQSHYLSKVMRIKENDAFSLFNEKGEWEAKVLNISKFYQGLPKKFPFPKLRLFYLKLYLAYYSLMDK